MSREHTAFSRYQQEPALARWLLAEKVSRALSGAERHIAAGGAGERVVRLAVPVGRIDPLQWLRAQPAGARLYWSGRDDDLEIAALGVADLQTGDVREGADGLRKRLALVGAGDGGSRYYGGMRFDPAREVDEEWEPFGAYRFVLPRFELRVGRGVGELSCNLVLPRDVGKRGEILERTEALSLPPENAVTALPGALHRMDAPKFSGWKRNVERALSAFAGGRMNKVVLARRAEFGFEKELDAALLAGSLKAETPGCFHFYIEPEAGTAFIGASPERLYRREGRNVKSEAVAGTRPRGESEADDEGLRDDLLGSAKDREEHTYVKVSIAQELRPLCDELEVQEGVSEMKLVNGRHLVSRVRGRLAGDVGDPEILFALHPTPAVGGYPRRAALEKIRSMEPFDRGWYAGPVGWIGADAAEFAVGIRSGLVRGRTLALFSGAGIVAGSEPGSEWAEIEQKLAGFTRIVGLEQIHVSR